MKIYAVELSHVRKFDESGIAVELDSESSQDLYTTDIYEAFAYFKNKVNDVYYGDILTLAQLTFDGEEEWITSLNTDAFDKKFGGLKETAPREIIVEYLNHENADAFTCFVLDEMVRQSSRYYNMHEICKAAGVNYSTFRGFKNNRQPISDEKLLAVLKTMNRVGVTSWNDALAEDIADVKERILVIG